VSAAQPSLAWDRQNPFAARFVRSIRLNREGSSKDTRQVVIDLEGSGITYEPGDALGVYPENCPDLVAATMEALGASGDESVVGPGGCTVRLQEALALHCALEKASPELLELLGEPAGDDGAEEREVIDVLAAIGRRGPPPAQIVAALAPLRPRLYSIASSLRAHPDEVHLTVGVVRYQARGRERKGVASTYLAERLAEGSRVKVFVQRSPRFRLPPSGDAPIIMIGPGTGIAPFRAFLEERRATGARGKAWLFFGEQRRDFDFLYQTELEGHLRDGFLSRLDTAFSRDQEARVYVQHRMHERSRELWAWLEAGAHVYVCGDARRMAKDVDDALRAILEREGSLSAGEARQRLADLGASGRYQRDVY
jgi:sulfite reductase (NADPH) flavoprotein alpha-component